MKSFKKCPIRLARGMSLSATGQSSISTVSAEGAVSATVPAFNSQSTSTNTNCIAGKSECREIGDAQIDPIEDGIDYEKLLAIGLPD